MCFKSINLTIHHFINTHIIINFLVLLSIISIQILPVHCIIYIYIKGIQINKGIKIMIYY